MKTLIIILISFITLNAQSEPLLLLGDDATVSYDSEAEAYFTGLTLSANRKDTISQFFIMVRDSLSLTAFSDYFDRFYLFANENEAAALTSLVHPDSTDAENISSTAFAVDRGYTGDGSADYINTHYTPTEDRFARNSAHASIYCRTAKEENSYEFGVDDGTVTSSLTSDRVGDGGYFRLNKDTQRSFTPTSSQGYYILSRETSTQTVLYYNGSPTDTSTVSSAAIAGKEFYVAQINNNGSPLGGAYSTKEYAVFTAGKLLTTAEAITLTNCIEWYLDAIGAGVIP